MTFFKYSGLVFDLSLTLLLIYDYFPDLPLTNIIPKALYGWIILGLIVSSLLSKRFHYTEPKKCLRNQIFSIAYLFLLMTGLTLLGGNSHSGLGFNNIELWIVIIFSISDILRQKRKLTTKNNF